MIDSKHQKGAFAERRGSEGLHTVIYFRYGYTIIMIFRLAILLFFCGTAYFDTARVSAAAPVRLTPRSGEYPLGLVLEYYEDVSHRWTVDDVASGNFQGTFRQSVQKHPNFTLTSSAFWIRFSVKNTYPTNETFILEYGYPTIDTLEFYRPRAEGSYSLLRTGDMFPYSSREMNHRNFLCHLHLQAGEEQTVYIRVASSGPLIAPLTMWHPDALLQKEYWERAVNGAFYGIMLVMLAYNLFLAFAVRERSYSFYVLYLASFVMYQMCLDGSALEYFWQNAPVWSNKAYVFFATITVGTASLFARDFLALRQHSRLLDRSMQALIAISVLLAVAVFFVPYRLMIACASVLGAVSSLITLAVAIFCVWRGFAPALYFLIAWGILIVAVFVFSTIGFGLVPFNYWTWYGSRSAATLEVVLLSLGLASRINLLRREQEFARFLVTENVDLNTINTTLFERNDALQRMNTKLDEANTFKTRMVSMVSHDLKNPLNTIRLLANTLRSELRADSQDGVETLNALVQETQRTSEMVEELLDMAALDMGKIALKRIEMDVSALVAAVVFMQSTVAEQKGQSITMQIPQECVIKGDEARLRQVIENLISNAIKFSPHGKTVHVHLSAPEQGTVRFSVHDEGPGLTDDDKNKVFGHFQKLSARPTGDEHSSGIGLAIVKQIVELHGGHIMVESEVGKGATFIVELPA